VGGDPIRDMVMPVDSLNSWGSQLRNVVDLVCDALDIGRELSFLECRTYDEILVSYQAIASH
jgi:hypothetical protein